MKTYVICSGGLDSVSLAHKVAAENELAGLISFDYGQRHSKELDFARAAADRLGVPFHLIAMRSLGAHLSGSALTADVEVPELGDGFCDHRVYGCAIGDIATDGDGLTS